MHSAGKGLDMPGGNGYTPACEVSSFVMIRHRTLLEPLLLRVFQPRETGPLGTAGNDDASRAWKEKPRVVEPACYVGFFLDGAVFGGELSVYKPLDPGVTNDTLSHEKAPVSPPHLFTHRAVLSVRLRKR